MTRQEMKEYLEVIHDRWHKPDSTENWDDFLKEGKLGTEREFDAKYGKSGVSITGNKESFVNGLLRKYFPTKLEKALK